MELYEFAIVCHPTEDEKKTGNASKIIVQPKVILAKDDNQAAMLAGREIPDDMLSKLEQLEVFVRPF